MPVSGMIMRAAPPTRLPSTVGQGERIFGEIEWMEYLDEEWVGIGSFEAASHNFARSTDFVAPGVLGRAVWAFKVVIGLQGAYEHVIEFLKTVRSRLHDFEKRWIGGGTYIDLRCFAARTVELFDAVDIGCGDRSGETERDAASNYAAGMDEHAVRAGNLLLGDVHFGFEPL
jgi:hypothetical protein